MPPRNLLLLLVVFMTQHQDMAVSNPIHNPHLSNCHWDDFKNLTQELYNQALKIYNSMNSTEDSIVRDDIPRIHCHHHCGPKDLVSNPETCLRRIAHILSYYEIALSTLPPTSQNQEFAKAKEIISDILPKLEACNYKAKHLTPPKEVTKEFLRRKIGSPLLSVSILIARVFSPGNPANHMLHLLH